MDSNLDFLIVLSIHAFSNLKTRSGSLNKKRKGGQMGMSDDDTGDDFDIAVIEVLHQWHLEYG